MLQKIIKYSLFFYLCISGLKGYAANNSLQLSMLQKKLALLEKSVVEAKAKGIDTKMEEVTITTAELFLNTFIPWDIAHPAELAKAYQGSIGGTEFLKGTPEQEAARTPEWELQQTEEILDAGIAKLKSVINNPKTRRTTSVINIDSLKVKNGFLCSVNQPVFSGGFIWEPTFDQKPFSEYIGGEVSLGFGNLQSDGTLSEKTIEGIVSKLNSLQSIGQKASISFGNNIPRWAINQWPDIDDYSTHHCNYDIDHPKVKELWAQFLTSLVPVVCNHPNKFDYQLAIEPQWPSIGTWQTNNASPYTFQKYTKWLGKLYGDVAVLNNSWGTNFTDFSEIKTRPTDNSNPAIWYDWCRFNQWRVTDFFNFIRNEIHKNDSNAVCHIRVSVGGIHPRSEINTISGQHTGIDREALIDMTEINGLDNFFEDAGERRTHNLYNEKSYSLNWLGHTMLLDFIRSLAPNKLIYDSEWHSISSVYYLNPEPAPGYMHTALWLSTLHGMGATKTWWWSRKTDGSIARFSEEFYSSPLVQPRLLNEYGVGLVELNAFGKEIVALERVPKQIYLLYSEASAIQSTEYLNAQMIAYEALKFTGLPIGFITENELQKNGLKSDCKWLIVAGASHVNKKTLEWLNTYTIGGRKLLVIGDESLKYNEYGIKNELKQLDFLKNVDKLKPVVVQELLPQIEQLMLKTTVKHSIRCLDKNTPNKTALGVLCRSADYNGKIIVSLINVGSTVKELILQFDGKKISKMLDLMDNKPIKQETFILKPLETKLIQITKL